MKWVLLPLVAAVFFFGCSDESRVLTSESPSTSNLERVGNGWMTYQYVGSSRDGVPIVRGQLSLFLADGNVRGTWQLHSALSEGRIGPQIGRGSLVGTYSNGALHVNLNPNFLDNNVLLTGRFDRNRYAGRWEWVGFPGVLNGGTFEAGRSVAEPVIE